MEACRQRIWCHEVPWQADVESFRNAAGVSRVLWCTDDQVNRAGSRSKQGIKTLALQGTEMRQVCIEDPEPEFGPVFPEVRHFSVVKATRGSGSRSGGERGTGGARYRRSCCCSCCTNHLCKPFKSEGVQLGK